MAKKPAPKAAPKKTVAPAKSESCANRGVARLTTMVTGHRHYAPGKLTYETLGALLADIRHTCDAMGLDFDERNRQGYAVYLSEVKTGGRATRVEG